MITVSKATVITTRLVECAQDSGEARREGGFV